MLSNSSWDPSSVGVVLPLEDRLREIKVKEDQPFDDMQEGPCKASRYNLQQEEERSSHREDLTTLITPKPATHCSTEWLWHELALRCR